MKIDYEIPTKFNASQPVVDLIGKMLRKKPEERITMAAMYDDMWFSQNFPESVWNLVLSKGL